MLFFMTRADSKLGLQYIRRLGFPSLSVGWISLSIPVCGCPYEQDFRVESSPNAKIPAPLMAACLPQIWAVVFNGPMSGGWEFGKYYIASGTNRKLHFWLKNALNVLNFLFFSLFGSQQDKQNTGGLGVLEILHSTRY